MNTISLSLFWLARIQGSSDARRDAVNDSSTLPVITLVLIMTVCTLIYMNLIELLLYKTHTSLDSLIEKHNIFKTEFKNDKEFIQCIIAHDGYEKRFKILHERQITLFKSKNHIEGIDSLKCKSLENKNLTSYTDVPDAI